mmetsp:Transcript_35225/g.38971  ORF Transcript_35225/g.38971 Transcript_35225/m.38971 type:complete len:97 (-) Transcript_35225:278-568(-)
MKTITFILTFLAFLSAAVEAHDTFSSLRKISYSGTLAPVLLFSEDEEPSNEPTEVPALEKNINNVIGQDTTSSVKGFETSLTVVFTLTSALMYSLC